MNLNYSIKYTFFRQNSKYIVYRYALEKSKFLVYNRKTKQLFNYYYKGDSNE